MILLDTHVLVWMTSDPKRLSAKARDAIRHARQHTGVAVATISLWELAWLAHSGRLQILSSVETFVRETVARIVVKPMTPEITAMAVRLPASYPKDPADRVISSTAIVEGIPLVTADQQIRRSKMVETIW